MGFLFSSPKPPPPPPTIDYEGVQAAGDAERRRQRAAAGQASTMLTGGLGDTSTATIGTTKLLGG